MTAPVSGGSENSSAAKWLQIGKMTLREAPAKALHGVSTSAEMSHF
jgi:hypothetical protein